MARIAGVDLPKNKRIEIALTYIFGIGKTRAKDLCKQAGFEESLRTHQMTEQQVVKLRSLIDETYKVEGLRKKLRKEKLKRMYLTDVAMWRLALVTPL